MSMKAAVPNLRTVAYNHFSIFRGFVSFIHILEYTGQLEKLWPVRPPEINLGNFARVP